LDAPSGWSIFKNTAAQLVGRNFIALSRLVVAGLIVRSYGTDIFAEYSLVFSILAIAEWFLDFGTTQVFVREICRKPENEQRLLRMMTAAKIVQIVAAAAALVIFLIALRYPAEVLQAGLIGGGSLVFFAGVLIYRVRFQAALTMEREVVSELISVIAMIPLIAVAHANGGGLSALIVCHVLSRAIFFALCFLFGRRAYQLSIKGVTWPDVRWSMRSSVEIGAIGFLIGIYEAVDLLLLSKLASLTDVGYYSGAQRLIWPLLLGLSSIGATLYPVAARHWPDARTRFDEAIQHGLDTVLLLAGFALCATIAGAEFFMSLLGPRLVAAAPVLRIFSLLCFVKVVTSTLGPILYVVHAQKQVLQFVGTALVAKIVLISLLVRHLGYLGVAYATLGVEICFAAIPTIYLLRRLAGYRIRWKTPLQVVAIALTAAAAPRLAGTTTGLASAIAAVFLYSSLALLVGTVRISQIQALLKWNAP
jgi:O-antigen/teichoic acid export membrane protein